MVIIVMGVSGAGKTTIGRAVARALAARFLDADDLHAQRDRERMASGVPIEEDARRAWLRCVGETLAEPRRRKHLVVACSALRRCHRDLLRDYCPSLRLVFVHPPPAILEARLANRRGHFASPELLVSQLETLEPPSADEGAIFVDNREPVETVAARVVGALVLDLEDPTPHPSAN